MELWEKELRQILDAGNVYPEKGILEIPDFSNAKESPQDLAAYALEMLRSHIVQAASIDGDYKGQFEVGERLLQLLRVRLDIVERLGRFIGGVVIGINFGSRVLTYDILRLHQPP